MGALKPLYEGIEDTIKKFLSAIDGWVKKAEKIPEPTGTCKNFANTLDAVISSAPNDPTKWGGYFKHHIQTEFTIYGTWFQSLVKDKEAAQDCAQKVIAKLFRNKKLVKMAKDTLERAKEELANA